MNVLLQAGLDGRMAMANERRLPIRIRPPLETGRLASRRLFWPLLFLLAGSPAGRGGDPDFRRTQIRSPDYFVADADVDFFMNHTAFVVRDAATGAGERLFAGDIGPKAKAMIDSAERMIVFSLFLFDSFYAKEANEVDVVGSLVNLLLEKRETHPGIAICFVLDPSHKAYGRRVSPAEKRLRGNGVDFFYSDLLADLKKGSFFGVRETAGHLGRGLDRITFNGWNAASSFLLSSLRVPGGPKMDDAQVTLETIINASLLKANHRKLLVVDAPGGAGYEAMVASANPHNASARHVNTALTVRGAPAAHIYGTIREDIRQSIGLGANYAHWREGAGRTYRKTYLQDVLPPPVFPADTALARSAERPVRVRFVTEAEIGKEAVRLLDGVGPGDEVRIQMFYLSYQPVLDAILRASRSSRTPVRLLLDANKDSFNRVKDGTPNRQVARWLLKEARKTGGRLEVRWYATHGEQNHAKILSITRPAAGEDILFTGSGNWTGRNLAGVNMEANLTVEGSRRLNESFNRRFDLFWSNGDGKLYSLDYETFREAAGDFKWKIGERPFYYSTF